MKALIGITLNYSDRDFIGLETNLGAKCQEWQLIASDYVNAIERAGGIPVLLPVTEHLDTLWEFVRSLDGIVFTGGSDINPELYGEEPLKGLGNIMIKRDQHEYELCNMIFQETNIPILGICRGCQMINTILGGTLYQDIPSQKEGINHKLGIFPKGYPAHSATLVEDTKLFEIFGKKQKINSLHHQGVKKLGEGLKESMIAPDGIIEGFEWAGDRYILGVQWHPEMMIDDSDEYLKIFTQFVKACSYKSI